MLTAATGLACFDVALIRTRHLDLSEQASAQRGALPQYQSSAAKWASLRELDADLLTICGPRDQTSAEAERHRRTRTAFIHCRSG
jgi:hypothetical protein